MDISKAKCPECGKPMVPTLCRCNSCRLTLGGEFTVPLLGLLPSEDQALVIAFVRSYGSIKKIQEVLGVSYPTARARIDRIIERLNDMMTGPENHDLVIEQLARGEITAAEAMERL